MKNLMISILFLSTLSAMADITFFKDDRPSGGVFSQLTLQDDLITSKVSFLESYENPRNSGQTVETRQLLGQAMECKVTISSEQIVDSVVCTSDKRDREGSLVVVTILRNENNNFDASVYSGTYDRFSNSLSESNTVLAYDLTLVN